MWFGIFFVGLVMAVGTLFVLDARCPAGFQWIRQSAVRTDDGIHDVDAVPALQRLQRAFRRDAARFKGLFTNHWLWAGVTSSLALHLAVIYTPFLQQAFSTTSLSPVDWLRCGIVASSVLWLCELGKAVIRVREKRHA